MKKFTVVQYWPKGSSIAIKFQSNCYLTALAALEVFKTESPEDNFAILQIM